jgi:hypothetical protein
MKRLKARHAAAATALAISALSVSVLTATPSYAAGGCVDQSQNGWTIRLCASKDFLATYSDFYMLKKGTQGNGCVIQGNASGAVSTFNSWGCSSLGVNQRAIVGTGTAIGGATIKTCVSVTEDVVPFRTFFSGCQTFTNV